MCRKEVERANTVSTFWSLDYEETTLGLWLWQNVSFFPDGILKISQTVSLYPLHAARSVWEDHPSSQAAALFKCVAAKAPPPVSSTQWGMWRAVGVDPLTSSRFQKQNAMGLTFLDVLLLAVSRMYTDRKLCSASMKWIIVNDLIGSVFGQSVCLSFWCLNSVFCWSVYFVGHLLLLLLKR